MKAYEKYKNTEIEWLDKIPEHWERTKLKFLSSFVNGYSFKSESYDKSGEFPVLTIANVQSYRLDMSEYNSVKFVPEDIRKEQILHKGDMLISMTGNVGRVCFVDIDNCLLNQRVGKIIVKEKVCKEFVFYVLSSSDFIKYLTINAEGSAQQNASKYSICNYSFALPPYDEQKRIADFLNAKTSELDAEKQNCLKQIELLKELKQSIILNAVMHGLHKDVEMKDSECDWLGLIPKSWSVKAYKYCMEIENGKDYKEVVSEEGYPVMGSGGQFAYASSYLYDGEAVLLGRKGTIDKPLYYKGKFWSVDTMFYAHPKGKNFCKFMYYAALCFPFDKYSTATALPSMTQTDLGNHKIAVPPVEEQKCIADYLDVKTAAIDEQIQLQEQQIKLIDELKQSIISQAVTGKIKVF